MDCTIWKQRCGSWLATLYLANVFFCIHSARILGIFPCPSRSHFFLNRQIMYSLLEAGHQITFVSDFQEPNPPINLTYVKIKTVEYPANNVSTIDFKSHSTLQLFRRSEQKSFQTCFNLIQTPEVQNFLKSDIRMYDILFVELTIAYECYLPLAEKFKIPVIGTLNYRPWVYIGEVAGNSHPLTVPSLWLPTTRKMEFSERLWNAFSNFYATLLIKYIWKPRLATFYKEYFPDYSLQRYRTISLLFSPNHASLFSTQLTPKVVEVAGIHLTPVKPLPQMLEKFINESENGVILLSFGTFLSLSVVDARLINIFRETFSCLPQRVIWKFEKNVENISENVLIRDWIPQRDILAHRNVKVFITHSGINGIYEAIDAGVPVVSLPIFWDQQSNAASIEDRGGGIRLDLKTLTKEILLNAINDVLSDERYLKQMQKLSTEFKDRPMSPKESVVYWTEYVLRHNGTQHLQPMSAEVSLYQYLLSDVLIFIVFTVLIASLTLKLTYKLSYKMLKNLKK